MSVIRPTSSSAARWTGSHRPSSRQSSPLRSFWTQTAPLLSATPLIESIRSSAGVQTTAGVP